MNPRLQTFLNHFFSDRSPQVDSLQGDASTRAYFRVSLPEQSYIAAVYPDSFSLQEFPYLVVTQLFEQFAVPVPRIHSMSDVEGIILQEDLGDLRFQDVLNELTPARLNELYREAITLLVEIQKTTDQAVTQNLLPARLAFDEEKLFWELNFFFEHYFGSYRRRRPQAEYEALILGELFALARRLASVPRVLCHRDYHCRNLMYTANRLVVIDHQDARMGPATYDLVSLLGDPYARLDQNLQTELKTFFWEQHTAAFGNRIYPSRQAFEAEYRLMMIQRMLKAVGTFSFQAGVRKNPTYIEYIAPAFQASFSALELVADLPFTQEAVETAIKNEE
ncbi:MAG: phosphotransferase [Acidobacteria bacterium]|nr:phosphotransferase [Acidobacteriota bacterium]